MAQDLLPDAWISGLTEDGTDVTFPIASVPELVAAEADTITGDIRKLMFAICDQLSDEWYALASADRPANMVITKSVTPDVSAGTSSTQYVFRFTTAVAAGSTEVVDEA